MKIGTLHCKLFGHKFCQTSWVLDQYQRVPTNFCVRCGFREILEKPNILENNFITIDDYSKGTCTKNVYPLNSDTYTFSNC